MNIYDYLGKSLKNKRLAKESFTFQFLYECWLQHLVERAMRLFVLNTDPVPSKEVVFCLLLNGTCGVTDKYKGMLGAYNGYYCGTPTIYYDMYEDYAVHSPVYADVLKVDKDVIVIDNNACRTSIYPIAHRYATMLAHTEVSIVNTLVNGRDSGGIPIASTEAQKQAIQNYRNSLFNGKVTSILDPAFSGVKFAGVSKNTALSVGELMELRTNLLSSYYNDLGVKTSKEKKGNMIVEEVNANESMLLLNISDMLHSWELGFDKVNDKYGTEWTVELAPELNYVDKDVI